MSEEPESKTKTRTKKKTMQLMQYCDGTNEIMVSEMRMYAIVKLIARFCDETRDNGWW